MTPMVEANYCKMVRKPPCNEVAHALRLLHALKAGACTKGPTMTTQTLTPKELAAEIGTTPKALRRFIRTLADTATKDEKDPIVPRVGQGHRYAITPADARRIKDAWGKAHASAETPKGDKAPKS